jgi:hypothetical protein
MTNSGQSVTWWQIPAVGLWVKKVSWEISTFFLDISKAQVENSPEFDPEQPVNIEYETRLYDYYGRPFEKNITKKLQEMIANPFK